MIKEIEKPTAAEIHKSLFDYASNPEKVPGSLQTLAKVLDIAFSHLNHMRIKLDNEIDNEINKPSYSVTTTEGEVRTFPRRSFNKDLKESEKLPVFNMVVKIRNDFNIIRDLAKLTKAVEEEHNNKMDEYGLDHPMMFIDTSKQLREYWKYIADHLAIFIQESEDKISKVEGFKKDSAASALAALREYQKVLEILAKSFEEESSKEDSEIRPHIDNTPHLELGWQETKKKLEVLLERLTQRHPKKKLTHYKKDPQKFIFRTIRLIGNKAQREILEKLNDQARESFINHAQSELFRKAGLGELKPFEKIVDKNQEKLTNLKDKLTSNKGDLDREKQNNNQKEVDKLILQRVKLQKELASLLISIVYSEELFESKSGSFSFSDVIEKNQANCMMKGELLHQLWANYCGEASLAALSIEHFFSIVKLADDTLLSLDEFPKKISASDNNIIEIGKHEKIISSKFI